MGTPYLITRDNSGAVGYGLKPAAEKFSATIVASTDTLLTLPTSSPYYEVIFSYADGYNIWVAYDQVASAPAGGTFATTPCELNPTVRRVRGGTVLHFFCTAAVDIGVVIYAADNAS